MNTEAWCKNGHSEGAKHNRIVMFATNCYLAEEKAAEAPAEPAKKTTRKGKK